MSRITQLAHTTGQLLPTTCSKVQLPIFQQSISFLVGGGAAIVSKIVFNHCNTNKKLNYVHASQASDREAISNQFYADEMARIKKENELVQFLLDALFKVNHHQQLSDAETTHIIDNIPLLVGQDEEPTGYKLADRKFFWGEQFDTLEQHVKNDNAIVENIYGCGGLRIGLLKSLICNMYASGNPTHKKVLNAFISKLIRTSNKYVSGMIYSIFNYIPDVREQIFEEITTHHTDNESYEHAWNIIRDIVWVDKWSSRCEKRLPMLSLVYILEFLARQRIGAGTLVTYLLLHDDQQRSSWILVRQLMQDPELTPRLAATYNNPAPEFDGFRDFVNQTNISYTKGSPEDEALYAIKREALRQAKEGAPSGRVQE